MDSIQEAMRKLRISDTNKLRNRKRKKGLVEGVTATRSKLKKLEDLWDQVYCTLVDVGDNEMFAICNDGKKGKYNPDQIATSEGRTKYSDSIIKVRYDKTGIRDPKNIKEDKFFAEAKRVAEKYGLRYFKTRRGDIVYFNIIVPQGEPVYFDLIPDRYKEKIAIENEEDLDNLPVSPFHQGTLSVTESLTENIDFPSPVKILDEEEILDFIDSIPKATKDRGPASLTFTIGFVTEIPVASKFKEGSRDHIDKTTGEANPTIQIIKCSEITGLYLERYQDSKKTKAHNRQMTSYRDNPEFEIEPKRDIPSWLEHTGEHRSLFRSKASGDLVLVPLVARNSRARNKYFISIDGGELKAATKQEVAQYLTPSRQNDLLNGREDRVKLGPDGREIVSAAQPLNFYLKKIYMIGNKGTSLF